MKGRAEQIRYSKDRLCGALLELLETSRYQDIPISEILDLAGISRRTFYRHFANKGELLAYYMEGLLASYLEQRESILAAESLAGMLEISLNFWYQHRKSLRLLILNQQFDLFLTTFNAHAQEIYRSINAPWHVDRQLDAKELGYIMNFIVGGYCNILRSWLVEEAPASPARVAQDLEQMFAGLYQVFA